MDKTVLLSYEEMERLQYWTVPPVHFMTESEEQMTMLNFVDSLSNRLASEPFVRVHSSALSKVKMFPANHEVDVAIKKFGGFSGTGIAQVKDINIKRKVLLRDYISEVKNQNIITQQDFLSNYSKTPFQFEYLSNVPVPENLFNFAEAGVKWNLNNCGITGNFDGINSPWLYVGTPGSVAPFHLEDGNLRSLNLHLGGAPKVWYGVHNEDIKKVENILRNFSDSKKCSAFWRHKQHFLDMSLLAREKIPIYRVTQHPGDFILTNSFHQVVNEGYNVNIAVNIWVGPKEILYTQNGSYCDINCRIKKRSIYLNTVKEIKLPIECTHCELSFRSVEGLKNHKKKCFASRQVQDLTHKCPICLKKVSQLDKHIKRQHNHLIHVFCVLCRKKYPNKESLEDHWKKYHLKNDIKKCTFCDSFQAQSPIDIYEEHDCE